MFSWILWPYSREQTKENFSVFCVTYVLPAFWDMHFKQKVETSQDRIIIYLTKVGEKRGWPCHCTIIVDSFCALPGLRAKSIRKKQRQIRWCDFFLCVLPSVFVGVWWCGHGSLQTQTITGNEIFTSVIVLTQTAFCEQGFHKNKDFLTSWITINWPKKTANLFSHCYCFYHVDQALEAFCL